MVERVGRINDENLYQPKIHAERIRGLYRIGKEVGLPMTVILDRAIQEFIERYEVQKNNGFSDLLNVTKSNNFGDGLQDDLSTQQV